MGMITKTELGENPQPVMMLKIIKNELMKGYCKVISIRY
jgi:hypothetical protein